MTTPVVLDLQMPDPITAEQRQLMVHMKERMSELIEQIDQRLLGGDNDGRIRP